MTRLAGDIVRPFSLSWSEVDPGRHQFDPDAALTVICALDPAGCVPVPPAGAATDPAVIAWSRDEGLAWTEMMSRALVGRFGRWAAGWQWAEELGGPPVGIWCCPRDSITSPAETLARVRDALCEWRDWLEDLAERFGRYPLDAVPADDRGRVWERATADLVNAVVDRTGAADAWYSHGKQVLTWFLTRWGVAPDIAQDQVERAVSGRFESWTEPERTVVDEVAGCLALALRTKS